jgi:hypothetical protein
MDFISCEADIIYIILFINALPPKNIYLAYNHIQRCINILFYVYVLCCFLNEIWGELFVIVGRSLLVDVVETDVTLIVATIIGVYVHDAISLLAGT